MEPKKDMPNMDEAWEEWMEKSEKKIEDLEETWVRTWNELEGLEMEGEDLMAQIRRSVEYEPEWEDKFDTAGEQRRKMKRNWERRMNQLDDIIERYKRREKEEE
jgi:hypothetical protein